MLRTLGIIGARAGSKRVKKKNTRPLGNKPLVEWTIEAGLAAKTLSRLVVSSDDKEILRIADAFDKDLSLPRPQELARDTSAAIEYVHHALEFVERQSGVHYEAIAIIQPTSPFTLASDIDGTIQLLQTTNADSAVSVMKLDHAIHPLKLKQLEGDKLIPYLEEENGRMAAHELPELYVRNCSVYVSRRHVIENNEVIGSDCRAYVMPQERSIDINSELDFAFAEFMLQRMRNAR